jgi:hypothetical protein
MGSKIITKTDRAMADQMVAVSDDPERADTLAKARSFKRTWLELAEALMRVQQHDRWRSWGFDDFEAYCRKELHLRASTVAKLLGSYRFLESSAPKVLERSRKGASDFGAPVPSIGAVEFVAKATERGAADEETLQTIHHAAFEEGAEPAILAKRFKEVAFPESDEDREGRQRSAIVATARRLASLIADEAAPVPRKLAIRVEETIGELLESLSN